MKIVFFCKRYYTNKDLLGDQFGRLFHYPVELSRMGCEVTVVALDYRNKKDFVSSLEGLTFRMISTTVFNFISSFLKVKKIISDLNPDCVIASGDSYLGYIGSRLAGKNRLFVFDVYDYYPAFLGNKIPGMKTLFYQALKQADLVLTPSVSLSSKLESHCSRIMLAENCVDKSVFHPIERSVARSELEIIDSKVVIGYFGSITGDRGPILYEACKLLVDRVDGLLLLLAGENAELSLNEKWVKYLGPVKQSKVPLLIGACDVVTIPYADSVFNRYAGACKIAEYMACERPVVATNIGGHSNIFADSENSLAAVDAELFAEAILKQLQNPQLLQLPEEWQWKSKSKELYDVLCELE